MLITGPELLPMMPCVNYIQLAILTTYYFSLCLFVIVDSKSKLFTKSYKGKSKRDDEEDAELEEMKLSAIASLGGIRNLLNCI